MLVSEGCVSALEDDLLESIALQHRCIFGGVVVAHGCGGEAVRGRKKRESECEARAASEGVQMPIWDACCHSRSFKVVMSYVSRAHRASELHTYHGDCAKDLGLLAAVMAVFRSCLF